MEDGFYYQIIALPFEAEWEYAAYGMINQNPHPSYKRRQAW